jgi:PAS domain S-box-containing protein
VAVALLLSLLLDPLITDEILFLLLFGAVMVGAWFGGLGSGLLATVLAALSAGYYTVLPIRSSSVVDSHIVALALFLSEGLLISALVEALRSAGRGAGADALTARGHEETVRQSEERFQAVFEQPAVGMVQVGLDGGWLRFNDKFCEILGYSREELPKVDLREIVMPEDLEADLERSRRILAGQVRDYAEEKRVRRKDGSQLWVRVTVSLMRDSSSLPEYFIGVIEDISSRRRAEEELRLLDRAVAASSNGVVITDPGLPDNPIVYVNPAFERITGYAAEEAIGRNCRFLQDKDRGQPALEELRAAMREARGCQVVVRNYRKDGSLFWNELSISAVHDEEGHVTNFVGVQNDVTERKRIEGALREAEAKYRTVVEHIPATTYIQEADHNLSIAFVSPQIETMLGYSPEEYASRRGFWAEIIHPEDREWVLSEDARTDETGEPFRVEYRALAKDGRTVWIRDEAVLVSDEEGNSRFWQGFMRDVTEHKHAEEELVRLASYAKLNPSPIVETTVGGEPTYLNPAAEAQFPGLLSLGKRHPALMDLESVDREIRETGEQSLVREIRVGDSYYQQFVSRLPENGLLRLYSIDITERRRAEDALRESEQLFRAIFEQAAVGMVEVSLDGEWIRFNDRFCEILGYTPEELPTVDIRDVLMPEDWESDIERVARMLDGEFRDYAEERLIRRKDGSQAWIYITVSLIYSSNGPERFIAVMEDISERKKTEKALTRSEILYRTVVEQAAENIFVVDLKSKLILEANAALQNSLGYGPEELKEMTLYDVVAHDQESIDENINQIIAKGHHFIGERFYRRKDGMLVDVEESVSTVSYEGRDAMAIVAHDITERKKAEENLRHSLSVLLALREAGQVLGSTLSSEEIVSRLLEIMRGVSRLTAVVLSIENDDKELRIWRSAGLESLRRRARFEEEAEAARRATLEDEEHRAFRLYGSSPEDGTLIGLCLPLRIKDRVVGVLEAYGEESLADTDPLEILNSLSSQAASALENAWLYEELGERERALQGLVGKLLGAQEEERRRVAYEVHDGLAQVAVAAHQNLQAFARRHAPGTERGRRELEQVLAQVRATVSDARRIIANLRPTALDDFGLAAALSLEVEQLREYGYHVDYEENLRDQRLPDSVEIALFRIAQEALTNVRKHAQTRRVVIRLGRSGNEAYLEVRDYGRGFDPAQASAGGGPGERVGLAGMRERIGMLSGELEIRSQPGAGTSIVVIVPVT